jgi:hypothetical protein
MGIGESVAVGTGGALALGGLTLGLGGEVAKHHNQRVATGHAAVASNLDQSAWSVAGDMPPWARNELHSGELAALTQRPEAQQLFNDAHKGWRRYYEALSCAESGSFWRNIGIGAAALGGVIALVGSQGHSS